MAKTDYVELPDGSQVKILHEDRSVLAIDKPPGWMLGPEDEEHVRRNLHIALTLGIEAGLWWARCRGLKFVRFIHRLDAPTTGVLLLAKSRGALAPFGKLFSGRLVEKTYLAVTDGIPKEKEWICTLPLGADPAVPGKHRIDHEDGKESETRFRVLETRNGRALVEAYPHTGRTHQIRLHLLAAGCPVAGDILYGKAHPAGLGLRAVELAYPDPFTRRPIRIRAERAEFEKAFGFGPVPVSQTPATPPTIDGDAVPAPPKPVPAASAPRPPQPPRPAGTPLPVNPLPAGATRPANRPPGPRRPGASARPNRKPAPTRPKAGPPAPTAPQRPPVKQESRGSEPQTARNHGKRRRRG
jgi:23S rRNA pseudouridine1911/1915/1917 synthase